uniref:Protein RER1 n=1 Tax=Rousettus aegyptiacus TaxID=9407 RepID=A0A7J8KFJ7_ROUAE|nr:retention in endoplasmic reticulum sorting receptor 1 [Rousettus aegyptiacus]
MSEGDSVGDSVHGKPSVVYRFFTRLGQIYQSWLDKSTPYTAVRWVVTLGLSFIYMIRVYLLQGWYIVTYALGIYHLNLFIAFLSPKVDPSLMEDSDDGPSLPTKQNEEFRPFIRRLPEFKFCGLQRSASCGARNAHAARLQVRARSVGAVPCRCPRADLSFVSGTRPPRASWWPWSAPSSRRSTSRCSGPSW